MNWVIPALAGIVVGVVGTMVWMKSQLAAKRQAQHQKHQKALLQLEEDHRRRLQDATLELKNDYENRLNAATQELTQGHQAQIESAIQASQYDANTRFQQSMADLKQAHAVELASTIQTLKQEHSLQLQALMHDDAQPSQTVLADAPASVQSDVEVSWDEAIPHNDSLPISVASLLAEDLDHTPDLEEISPIASWQEPSFALEEPAIVDLNASDAEGDKVAEESIVFEAQESLDFNPEDSSGEITFLLEPPVVPALVKTEPSLEDVFGETMDATEDAESSINWDELPDAIANPFDLGDLSDNDSNDSSDPPEVLESNPFSISVPDMAAEISDDPVDLPEAVINTDALNAMFAEVTGATESESVAPEHAVSASELPESESADLFAAMPELPESESADLFAAMPELPESESADLFAAMPELPESESADLFAAMPELTNAEQVVPEEADLFAESAALLDSEPAVSEASQDIDATLETTPKSDVSDDLFSLGFDESEEPTVFSTFSQAQPVTSDLELLLADEPVADEPAESLANTMAAIVGSEDDTHFATTSDLDAMLLSFSDSDADGVTNGAFDDLQVDLDGLLDSAIANEAVFDESVFGKADGEAIEPKLPAQDLSEIASDSDIFNWDVDESMPAERVMADNAPSDDVALDWAIDEMASTDAELVMANGMAAGEMALDWDIDEDLPAQGVMSDAISDVISDEGDIEHTALSNQSALEELIHEQTLSAEEPPLEVADPVRISNNIVALSQLRQLADHADAEVRQEVAGQMLKLAEQRKLRAELKPVIPVLGRLSQDAMPQVRTQAVQALGQIQSFQVLPFLRRALRDTSPEVTQAAAIAIRQVKPVTRKAVKSVVKHTKR